MSNVVEKIKRVIQDMSLARTRGYEQISMVRPLLNTVSRGTGYEFVPGDQFAIDLTKTPPVAYFDMNFYTKEQGYTPEQGLFALLHEIRCHLVEKDKMQESDEGEVVYEERKEREKQIEWLPIWENCRTDASGNMSILLEIAPVLQSHAESLYIDKLFPTRDLRKLPRHLQFMYKVLLEKMLPNASDIQVLPEVIEAMNKLKQTQFTGPDGQVHQDVLEYATRPDRLYDSGNLALWRYQASREYIEPEIEQLYQEDLKNPDPEWQKQKGKGKARRQNGPGSPFAGEYQDYESRIHPHTWDEDNEAQKTPKQPSPQQEQQGDETDKDDVEDQSADSIQDAEQNFDERERFMAAHGLSENEMRIMESYDNVYKEISQYVEKLREVFLMILNRRKWYTTGIAHNQERGRNTGRSLRNQYIANQDGQKHATRPARVNISGIRSHEEILPIASTWHLILDQSGSMNEGRKLKLNMQIRATVLFLETLARFEEETEKLDAPLEIESELRAFGTHPYPTALYKTITDKLSMRKRVEIFQEASYANGGTNDFDSLQEVISQIKQRSLTDSKYRDSLASGARKEFVVVLTDGISNDPSILEDKLQELINMGVQVVGVGMTSSGHEVMNTYNINSNPHQRGSSTGKICHDISKLPDIIAEMLEANIKSLDIL